MRRSLVLCFVVLGLLNTEATAQQGGNYAAPRNGQISFNHERMLILWEPRRRASSEGTLSEVPTIDQFFSEFDPLFPGDISLPGRSRSALRSVVHETREWPDATCSAFEYGLAWAPNGSKINLSGSQFLRTFEFNSVTAIVRFDVEWDSPGAKTGDRYAQILDLLDKNSHPIAGVGRSQASGDAWRLGTSFGTDPLAAPAPSGSLLRVWYRAADAGVPSSGAFRVETWDTAVQNWRVLNDSVHSDSRSVSRLNVGLQASHREGADAGAMRASTSYLVWDTDHSDAGPADLSYDIDRSVVVALGDSHDDGSGLVAAVRAYVPLGEFDHAAPGSSLEIVAGLAPDLSDGVAQPNPAALAPGDSPEYVTSVAISEVHDGVSTRLIKHDERLYWRPRITLGDGTPAMIDLPIHSFQTPPDPDGLPQQFRIGFLSCHTSSGDAHPILAYRVFQERGCRFVLRLGDNGYNDSQIFDRASDVTGPWAAQEVEDLFTALLPTYFDEELAEAVRTMPMWDQGDDHDYVANNWHAGFADPSRWEKASFAINGWRQEVTYTGSPPALRSQVRGATSNRLARYIGEAPDNNAVFGFESLFAQGFTPGEDLLNANGNTIGSAVALAAPHGWPSPGAALYYLSAEQLDRNGLAMWNAWQGSGFLNLGVIESGTYSDRDDSLNDGHYYRSFDTARTLVVMLDNRRFQEPVRADEDTNADRVFLGESQLTWLESTLKTTDKPLVVIGSTGVVGDVHSDNDNWFAIPSWRTELYRIGKAADLNPNIKRVLYLVGDRHSTFAHSSRMQEVGDPDPGLWTLGTYKGVEFDAGPAAMSALRDSFNDPENFQYRWEQVPRGPVEGQTVGWTDLIPAGAEPLDSKYIVNGDNDEIIHFSTLLAKTTDLQGDSPPKFVQMTGTVEIDEVNETFTLRAWDTEGDLAVPVVGQADETDTDPYANGRLLWSRTFPFERPLGPCPGDLSGDRVVDSADLAQLLAAWGMPGITDFDGSGSTGADDLATLLAGWGLCPL